MGLLFVYFSLALSVSFYCSIAEAALLSVRPSYIAALEHRARFGSGALRKLKSNLDRSLAAILTLNTIAHTVGAVGVGAQAVAVFGNEYTGVISAVLTVLILVLSEIIPKTLGAIYWDRLAPLLAPSLLWMTWALLPATWLSERLTRLLARAKSADTEFARDEVRALVSMGRDDGAFSDQEIAVVNNILRLNVLASREIMTPRTVMITLARDMTVADYAAKHRDMPFTRLPLQGPQRDQISSYVLKGDLLAAVARGETDTPVQAFERPILIVLDLTSVSKVFDLLLRERSHIAIIVDEYGSVQGLLTLEDVVETLVGMEITDELDTIEDMQALAERQLRARLRARGIDIDDLRAEQLEGE